MLIAFVLIILMILGDVYRGEIQNKLHRIYLLPRQRETPPLRPGSSTLDRDISFQIQNRVVPISLDKTQSNLLLYLRYRDCLGRLKTTKIHHYRVKFSIRIRAIYNTVPSYRSADHRYTEAERDRLLTEDDPTMVSLAASRVDYIYDGILEKHKEKLAAEVERLRTNSLRRIFANIKKSNSASPSMWVYLPSFIFRSVRISCSTNIRTRTSDRRHG